MTKEEAINELNNIKDFYIWLTASEGNNHYSQIQALDIAIKSLKGEAIWVKVTNRGDK
jgi:hypothetical protein